MELNLRPSTPDDIATLPAFDFTKLTALNTCPRWGLIRYDQHRRMPGASRSTALDMGSAAHECFAAIRYGQLLRYGHKRYPKLFDRERIMEAGRKAFNKSGADASRFDAIFDGFFTAEDDRRAFLGLAFQAANMSGYYDDPDDKRRTLSNLEASLIGYVDAQELDREIPLITEDGFIGIEVPFDIVLSDLGIRYIGRVDGVATDGLNKNKIVNQENKTASRLGDAWYDSFVISHQVTGYCVAITTLLGTFVGDTVVHGLTIPLPKSGSTGGISRNPQTRDIDRFVEWYKWVKHTTDIWRMYKDDPLNAPEYSNACNRYFTSCSFIPLCAVHGEERQQSFNEMEEDIWTPLDEVTKE